MLLLLLSRFSHVQLRDPIDVSPPGSPIPGILQARTLEWVAISFSNAWKWKVKVKSLSRVQLQINYNLESYCVVFETPFYKMDFSPLNLYNCPLGRDLCCESLWEDLEHSIFMHGYQIPSTLGRSRVDLWAFLFKEVKHLPKRTL